MHSRPFIRRVAGAALLAAMLTPAGAGARQDAEPPHALRVVESPAFPYPSTTSASPTAWT